MSRTERENEEGKNMKAKVNEMFETEKAVVDFLKPRNVGLEILKENLPQTPKIDAKTEELRRCAEVAGFTHYDEARRMQEWRLQMRLESAEQKERQKQVLRNAMKALGLKIVLKKPPFYRVNLAKEITRTAAYERTSISYFDSAVIIEAAQTVTEIVKQKQVNQVTEMGKSWLGKPKLRTRNFTEIIEVPVTKTITEEVYLIEQTPQQYIGAIPDFAVKAAALAVQQGLTPRVWIAGTRQELQQYVKTDVSTKYYIDPIIVGYPTPYPTELCLLIAAWGKDLEQIDQYFSEKFLAGKELGDKTHGT